MKNVLRATRYGYFIMFRVVEWYITGIIYGNCAIAFIMLA